MKTDNELLIDACDAELEHLMVIAAGKCRRYFESDADCEQDSGEYIPPADPVDVLINELTKISALMKSYQTKKDQHLDKLR